MMDAKYSPSAFAGAVSDTILPSSSRKWVMSDIQVSAIAIYLTTMCRNGQIRSTVYVMGHSLLHLLNSQAGIGQRF